MDTFVALKLAIANWRWAGVPFYLRTGKRLPQRFSEIDPWLGMAGKNLDRPPDQIDRGLNVASLQFDDPQQMQRPRMVRQLGQDAAIPSLRLG